MNLKRLLFFGYTLIFISCTVEGTGDYTCTISLNGAKYSEKSVNDCDLCTAPRGYSASCSAN